MNLLRRDSFIIPVIPFPYILGDGMRRCARHVFEEEMKGAVCSLAGRDEDVCEVTRVDEACGVM